MKKYSLLAVFLLLMCNVSVCGQTGRILFVDTTFIAFTKLLQKSEMRKDIVIELSYKGFSCASDYS